MAITLHIETEGPAIIGDHLHATVVLDSDTERAIDGLDVVLEGRRMLFTDQQQTDAHPFYTKTVQLLGRITVAEGTQRVPASIALPDDLPPSCDTGDLIVTYALRASADVPWWFDPSASCDVTLALPAPGARPPRKRWVAVSKAGRNELFVELALDDTALAPGESITGAFSVGNVGGHRLDGAGVALVRKAGAVALAVPGAAPIFKSLVGAGEGAVIRFSLPIPREAVPSHKSRIGEIARALVVSIDGTSVSCAAPVEIDAYPPRSGGAAPEREVIGGNRWRAHWQDAASRHGLTCDRRALRLQGALAGGAVDVVVESRGNQLVGELGWERFGIDLSVEPRGLIEVTDVDLRDVPPTFRKRFAARGREDAQVASALGDGLCEAIAAFREIALRDDGATVTVDAQARDAAALREFLDHIGALAGAVVAAAPEIAAPACFHADSLAAWRAFAESSTGRLRAGSMSVFGATIDGDRLDLETLFEAGSVDATRLTMALDPEVPVPEPLAVPAPLLASARALLPGHNDPPIVALRPTEMVITLPGMLADPGAIRPLVAEMQRWAQALRGETSRGPYR